MSKEIKKQPKKDLEQTEKDLNQSKIQDSEKEKIEGGFSAGKLSKDDQLEGNNIWCNEKC
ncbi:hypothetical protein [Sphingobacterium sp.]|uniref:hypothetical protein n=1 Tax=Sphingobacterium sp. TaxID=341027 RepID=UPI002899BB8C|nr:hypothetical protein [Sphingobacterium sp.]